MFFCQWGDCDFLYHLTLMEGEERVTILTPVLPGQSSIRALVAILSWNWVACLKMDGLECHYISFIVFACYVQLCMHGHDSSPVYTWQLLEAGLCTQGHRNLSDRHHHWYNFQLYKICSIHDHVCKCKAKFKFNTIVLFVEFTKATQKEKPI